MRTSFYALPLLCLAACASQATPRYEGEPLAVIRGTVKVAPQPAGSTAQPPSGMSAAILWQALTFGDGKATSTTVDPANPHRWVATPTPVTGSFPADFEIAILTPPPANRLVACDPSDPNSARIAWGAVIAIGPNATPDDLQRHDVYGSAEGSSSILYADKEVPKGTVCAFIVDAAIPAGYHVLMPRPAAELKAENDAYETCVEAKLTAKQSPRVCESELKPSRMFDPLGFDRHVTLVVEAEPWKDYVPPPEEPPVDAPPTAPPPPSSG